jgi:hypothetical protein
MRTILLAIVLVLGFVSEAGAADYIFTWGEQVFGIYDAGYTQLLDANENIIDEIVVAEVVFGPLGSYRVPFTATQGLVGFCVILGTLIVVPAVLVTKRKRA